MLFRMSFFLQDMAKHFGADEDGYDIIQVSNSAPNISQNLAFLESISISVILTFNLESRGYRKKSYLIVLIMLRIFRHLKSN